MGLGDGNQPTAMPVGAGGGGGGGAGPGRAPGGAAAPARRRRRGRGRGRGRRRRRAVDGRARGRQGPGRPEDRGGGDRGALPRRAEQGGVLRDALREDGGDGAGDRGPPRRRVGAEAHGRPAVEARRRRRHHQPELRRDPGARDDVGARAPPPALDRRARRRREPEHRALRHRERLPLVPARRDAARADGALRAPRRVEDGRPRGDAEDEGQRVARRRQVGALARRARRAHGDRPRLVRRAPPRPLRRLAAHLPRRGVRVGDHCRSRAGRRRRHRRHDALRRLCFPSRCRPGLSAFGCSSRQLGRRRRCSSARPPGYAGRGRRDLRPQAPRRRRARRPIYARCSART